MVSPLEKKPYPLPTLTKQVKNLNDKNFMSL